MVAALADALRRFGAAYLATHALSTPQAKAWRGIVACRTAALGGQQLACDTCDHSHWQYHSCRNRHCPQCGARAKDAWLQGRLTEVLPVPYAHLVFALPHSLNGLYGAHPRWLIDTLFACTAQTLSEFAANPKWMGVTNGTPAFSLVLHTWTQDLQRHIHLHAVMACGVLDPDGHWAVPARTPYFLFPVEALSPVFRGKFMAALAGPFAAPGILSHCAQSGATVMRGVLHGLASQRTRLVVALRLAPDNSRTNSQKRLDDTPMRLSRALAAAIAARKHPKPGHDSTKEVG